MHPKWEVKVVDAQPSVIWRDLLFIHFLYLYWISSLSKEEKYVDKLMNRIKKQQEHFHQNEELFLWKFPSLHSQTQEENSRDEADPEEVVRF